MAELLEKLADIEHQQWSHWTNHFLANITLENLERWKVQAQTNYQDLSEAEKESDRKWARIVLQIME